MVVASGRPMKRAKRRVTADLQDFRSFPAAEDGFEGPFRSNVKAFLARHAWNPPPPSMLSPISSICGHLRAWRLSLRVGEAAEGDRSGKDPALEMAVVALPLPSPAVVDLEVVEEDVTKSKSVYCDQCRVVGWSGHPVCGKRYHFIIRNDGNPGTPAHQICARCRSVLDPSDVRCATCNFEVTTDDLEDWIYCQLDDSTHLLHGVVHTNGYGHLLRVNGREGGSKYLTGSDIMGFWDRLCKMLWVRKVTVMDISKKYGLEYRILHAVNTGRPWYGHWGYEFGAGSFAVTAEAYAEAVDTLSRLPISLFFSHARSPRTQLQDVIALYWSLSDHKLQTIRDLFCFVLELIHDAHGKTKLESMATKKESQAVSRELCDWAKEDIGSVDDAILKVLRTIASGRWTSWRALKGAVWGAVKSPELLDYCLKGLSGKLIDDGMVVVARCNEETNSIEYRLEALSGRLSSTEAECKPSEDLLVNHLKFLYDELLNPKTMHSFKPQTVKDLSKESAMKLLDCKQFTKNYDKSFPVGANNNPYALRIWCEVVLVDQPKDYTAPPAELLVLPETATVADLKVEATKAFQEAYVIFQRFQAEQLLDYGRVSDATHVKLLLGTDGNCRVKGTCLGDHYRLGQFRMERGTENWIVDCVCGAKDDDGERMVACDACGVWQHTRCVGINDCDEVPRKYVCWKCTCVKKAPVAPVVFHRTVSRKPRDITNIVAKHEDSNKGGRRCKDEMSSSIAAEVSRYGCLASAG